ncbi:carbon storage regulator [Agaribacterium haliotis]|uniref:carbon storage regulator n=1 Tax=Agaribacterium haliotis TaxID=2013869 RepID=UPI000BB5703F|nr:carbon storage regulator [Agaribacterium haliotis]
MLILTRKAGSADSNDDRSRLTLITEDGPISIVLNEGRGNQVIVGIDAPDSVEVVRDELLELDYA